MVIRFILKEGTHSTSCKVKFEKWMLLMCVTVAMIPLGRSTVQLVIEDFVVNKSAEQTIWSIAPMSSIQDISLLKTWAQKVIPKRSLIADALLITWLDMEFDLFALNIVIRFWYYSTIRVKEVGGVVSLASTWLTLEEKLLRSHWLDLPLVEFML